MKFSIIIPCLNSFETIRKCIDSVLSQRVDLEVIIIDGGSVDGTLEVIRQIASSHAIKYVSEKDRGVYYAMNKGIDLATGDIVSILNSNDFLVPNVLLKVEAILNKTNADFVYGAVDFISTDETHIRITPLNHKSWGKSALQQMPTPHVGLFVRIGVMKALNGFNVSYKIVADQDFVYRLSQLTKYNGIMINDALAELTPGGMSSGLKARLESYKLAINNGRPIIIAAIVLIKQIVAAKFYHSLPSSLQKVASYYSRHKKI